MYIEKATHKSNSTDKEDGISVWMETGRTSILFGVAIL